MPNAVFKGGPAEASKANQSLLVMPGCYYLSYKIHPRHYLTYGYCFSKNS